MIWLGLTISSLFLTAGLVIMPAHEAEELVNMMNERHKITAEEIAQIRLQADKGNRNGEVALGTLSCTGKARPFLPQDDVAAVTWWRKAADQGQPYAALYLGMAYLNGFGGVQTNKAEGLKWVRFGAEKENPIAQFLYGSFYANGKYVPKDAKEALKWWQKAADHGITVAEGAIGALYASGDGVPRDYKEAMTWTRRGATHGSALAQYNLGQMYSEGHGVAKDQAKAVSAWQDSADQDHTLAQVRLANVYAAGDGIKKDVFHADWLYNIVLYKCHRSPQDSRSCQVSQRESTKLEQTMSAQDVNKAKRMAKDWEDTWFATYGQSVTDGCGRLLPR